MACASYAEPIKIVTFNTGLARKGPGLLVRDIDRGDTPDIDAVLAQLTALAPDIAILQGVDFDHNLVALRLISQNLRAAGLDLPHLFARLPNTGLPTPFDLDRDGRFGRARDKQGFGYFKGYDGIAVLSRFPITAARDLSDYLWRDLPGAEFPQTPDGPYYSDAEMENMRLHTTGAWIVTVDMNGTALSIAIAQAGPPVFDGPEDRNGKRNRDEIRFWTLALDGKLPGAALSYPFVFAGGLNADPFDGEGSHGEIRNLLNHPRIQDPTPKSAGGRMAKDVTHKGPPELDTTDWPDGSAGEKPGPGNLRVDYLLPSRGLKIIDSGVDWPATPPALGFGSAHRPVWITLDSQSLDPSEPPR